VVRAVDAAMRAAREAEGLAPAPFAPDLTLQRRLSLALTGTIPSLQEIRAFEAQPPQERLSWWLDHLLADRRFSDTLAERFARATVGVEGGPFLVYRRRRFVSWLSDQFIVNRPFDEVVRALIAGTGTWTSRPETNFVTVTVDQNNEGTGPDEVKLAARLTRAFLGMRIDCVQCHDDKFGDRWKQQDFHGLAAFFAGTDLSLTGVRDADEPYRFKFRKKPDAETVPPAVPFLPKLMPAEGPLRERLARWATHPDNRAFARATVNRVWALMAGRPLVEPVDEISLEGPWPPGLEPLADDLASHGFDLHRLIRLIAATEAFRRDSRAAEGQPPPTERHEKLWAAFPTTRLRPDQVAGAISQAASLSTLDAESHIFVKLSRGAAQNEFLRRYGDFGEDEFTAHAGTIPQRLVLMNGEMVEELTDGALILNAATRIGATARTDAAAVEAAYLAVLTRRPTPPERDHFERTLLGKKGPDRQAALQDLFWTLINATEFSWNH
jgi:hypothetical protein